LCSIHCDVSLDLVVGAPPGWFLVERFGKIEMFNVECSSSLYSPPEKVPAETDPHAHAASRNLLVEGHIKVDSSRSAIRLLDDSFETAVYQAPRAQS